MALRNRGNAGKDPSLFWWIFGRPFRSALPSLWVRMVSWGGNTLRFELNAVHLVGGIRGFVDELACFGLRFSSGP